jgi:hypothetical protein
MEAKRREALEKLDLAIKDLEQVTEVAAKVVQATESMRRLRGELEALNFDHDAERMFEAVNRSIADIRSHLAELSAMFARP